MKGEGSTVLCRIKRCPTMTSPGRTYHLSPFNYLFTIGDNIFESAQLIKPTYRARYNNYVRKLLRLDKSMATNINIPAANYGSEYYSSSGMIFRIREPGAPPLTALQIAQNEWDAKKKAWRGRGWNWRASRALRRFVRIHGPRPTAETFMAPETPSLSPPGGDY